MQKIENIERCWVIGDVHGCMFTLENLFKRLPNGTTPIFIGDLVDRGNYSKEVMEFVIENNFIAIFGNHEYLMFNYARDAIIRNKHAMWSLNSAYGGAKTIKSYKNHIDTLLRHIDYIPAMPKYLEIGGYFLTHGFGLPYYRRKDDPNYYMKLYTNRLENNPHNWESEWHAYEVTNIFGHTPYEEVFFGSNFIGIDTGCAMGNQLSAVRLGSHEVVSVATDRRDLE